MARISRRGLALSLAALPVAGWGAYQAIDFAAGRVYGGTGEFHFPDDPSTPLWRALKALVPGPTPLSPPALSPAIVALDGQRITLRGFMVPLTDGLEHRRFLFTANPPGCPGCSPLDPAVAVDVRSRLPMVAGTEPLLLHGTLRLRRQEALVYRLDGAEAEA